MTIINKKYHLNTIWFWISLVSTTVGILYVDRILESLLVAVIFFTTNWAWTLGNRPENKKEKRK